MKFRYIGEEPEVEAFGLVFPLGQSIEVKNEHAISCLSENPQFENCEGDTAAPQPKRRGRQKKV